MKGNVSWFAPTKGYGFLQGEDGKGYFVHYTSIITTSPSAFKMLTEGQEVNFEPTESERGPAAVSVKVLR